MTNHLQFTVQGSPIRLYAQENDAGTPGPAIVLLHGSGGNIDFWTARLGPYLRSAGIALYAPHYFDRTGTVRADLAAISDKEKIDKWLEAAESAVCFVAGRPGVDPERIVLAGISLGAFLGLAYAARSSARDSTADLHILRAVIDVSGGLVAPYDRLATERFPPTLILHGGQDTIVSPTHAAALDEKLTELNVAHRTEILDGEGHWFSAAALPRILLAVSNFLQEHLQNTAARVPAM